MGLLGVARGSQVARGLVGDGYRRFLERLLGVAMEVVKVLIGVVTEVARVVTIGICYLYSSQYSHSRLYSLDLL